MTSLAPPPSLDPAEPDRTTTLAAFADEELGEGGGRGARLLGEALVFTGVGVLLTRALDVEQPGVLSLFLAAGATSSRAKEILRASEEGAGCRPASDLLAMFFGVTLAYVAAGLVLGPESTARDFAFALEAARAGTDDLLHRRFPGPLPLLGHNLAVLAGIVVLSVVYRTYGALLALTWNACVWGLLVATLTLRSIDAPGGSGRLLLAGLALVPHLALEAFAYASGSLAGARLGRRLTLKVGLRVPFRSFGVAILAVAVASLVEAHLPALVLQGLRGPSAPAASVR